MTTTQPRTMIWESPTMEPIIDFGDEITVIPTNGFEGDGVYLLKLPKHHIQPPQARRLCGEYFRVVRRVKHLADGKVLLTSDEPSWNLHEVVNADDMLKSWIVEGKVSVSRRNGRGYHADTMNKALLHPDLLHELEELEFA